ncbi:hypothetical protein J8J14_20605 [Roseomonas sp. SSH11]|uniref:Uncharacterized protein n=1 Tax=Pararoseomonas baculiformis TaxID=2820812 RepID=A0ABS4AJH2_9PROT|nr:hypothetical protein [Pararoseomonas baculiformis]MBP0447182.1 hypothetical protein [Pararoseomonas baculiformis]
MATLCPAILEDKRREEELMEQPDLSLREAAHAGEARLERARAKVAEALRLCHEGLEEAGTAAFHQAAEEFGDLLASDGYPVFWKQYFHHVLARRSRWPKAREFLSELSKRYGEIPVTFAVMGAHAKTFFSDDERIRIWRRAAEAEPGDIKARMAQLRLLIALRRRNELPACADPFFALLRSMPPDSSLMEAWCLLGDAYLIENASDRAELCYRSAHHANAGQVRPLLGLASVALDGGRRLDAVTLLSEALTLKEIPEELRRLATYATECWSTPDRTAALPSVEVAVFTHLHRAEKLRENPHLAAPGLGLIELTLTSLRASLKLGSDIPITVFYDHRPTELNETYRLALENFCAQEGLRLVVNEGFGLRRQWLDAMARAEADLVMIVEHDHEFLTNCPSLEQIRGLFAERPDMQYLRLARRANVVKGYDTILIQSAPERKDGIYRTPGFSNTPHLVRLGFLRDMIGPSIGYGGRDTHNFGAGGVEDTVNSLYRALEARVGLPAAMRLFGTLVYGNPGDKRRVVHLGV